MVPHIRRVWHSLSVSETVQALHVDPELGLSEAEVQQRQEGFGRNELVPVHGETLGHVLLEAVTEPMILLLLAVGVLYAFWGETWETATVFSVIAVLVSVEVYNEWRAEQALAGLSALSQPLAVVRRQGQWWEIPVAELVPGDIVLLLAGRRVPADVRLLQTHALALDESILTGESLPVEKDAEAILSEVVPLGERKNLAFAGTLVVRGRGLGVVIATGAETEWGRIARQTAQTRPEKTPLQLAMRELARWTVLAALGFTALAAVLAYLRQLATGQQALLSALALAFATIPEELPIIITIVLALGGWRLARQRAIVRRLAAVETLGDVTLIAADKTGTITENRMAVAQVEPREHERLCLELAVLCSETITATTIHANRWPQNTSASRTEVPERSDASLANLRTWLGDPTEAALLERAEQLGITSAALCSDWLLRQEFPFDPSRKRMTTVWQVDGDWPTSHMQKGTGGISPSWPAGQKFLVAVKGAPERVLPLCTNELATSASAHLESTADSSPATSEPATGQASLPLLPGQTELHGGLASVPALVAATPGERIVPLTPQRHQVWQGLAETLASRGWRVLAFAYRWASNQPRSVEEAEASCVFVGLVALADPPRPEVAPALAECRQAGIRVLMITGDHPHTARYVAQAVGFEPDTPLITGPELDSMSDATLQEQLRRPLIVARATPSQKLRLVQLAKSAGERVAVTGDGINDAPALRAADVGIAMGQRGSDVAREAADLILADDNFATLVHAIREGRLLFDNLSKSVRYYLACKVALVAACLTGVLTGVGIPFHPLQIILMELMMDLGASVALVGEPAEGDLMRRPPRDPRQPFLHGGVLRDLFGSALALFLVVVLVFLGLRSWRQVAGPVQRETLLAGSFLAWLLGHVLLAWVLRTDRVALRQQGWLSNRALLVWTLAVLALLAGAWLPLPISRVFLLQNLSGREAVGIALWACLAMALWRWLRGLSQRGDRLHSWANR